MAIYESGEMYLETILILQKRGIENVRAKDIVKEMNYSKPSVSIALSNLKKDGYVTVDANGFIEFTEAGKKIAKNIYDKHTLLTKILVDLGVSEKTAAEDACRIEHVISDESIKAIKKHLQKKSKND